MAEFDDIKTMLNSLLKASPLNMGTEEKSDDEYKPEDGYDNDNPLSMTELYRDEMGNRLPAKLHVIPLFGRPILPSQITTIQLNIEWLDVITEVISSSHHTFAMFAVGEDKIKKAPQLSIKDFPKTGTVVRLLSARSGPDEIDIVCEGVRRVSLIEVSDIRNNLAQVRYPEIEYRLANPTTRDKLNANNQALRDSLDRSVQFDKQLQEVLKEQRDYARSIGVEIEKKTNSFDFNYYIYSDEKTIGRISKAKLESLFEFLDMKDLSDEQKQQIALYLARPSKDEIDKLNTYYTKAVRLISDRSRQLHADLAEISPKARQIAQGFINSVEESVPTNGDAIAAIRASAMADIAEANAANALADVKASSEANANKDKASAAEASTSDAKAPTNSADSAAPDDDHGITTVETDANGNEVLKARVEFNGEISEKNLSDIARELASMLSVGALKKPRDEHNETLLVGGTSNARQADIDAKAAKSDSELNHEFMSRISQILEGESDRSTNNADGDDNTTNSAASGHSRNDLFELIAKVGQQEEEETAKAKRDFKDAALREIIANTPKDESGDAEPVTGPNFGFINNDTAVVTFMPGRDSSEDLLLRLTEIQKEHEAQLRKEASAAAAIQAADDADQTLEDNGYGSDGSARMNILNDVQNEDGSTETGIVISGDSRMNDDLKEFLSFLMHGKDLAQITSDMTEEEEESEDNIDEQSTDDKGSGDKSTKGKKPKSSKGSNRKSAAGRMSPRGGKWGDLQRAAMIRSKLASLLGGKVVFGVSAINEKQDGAQKEVETRAYCLGVTAALQEMIPLNPMITEEMRQYLSRFDITNPSTLADCAASITQAKPTELQEVLDTVPILPRLKLTFDLISRELSAAKLQDKIKVSVAEKIQKRQKDFFLREQLTEIKKELGLTADEKDIDVEKFKERMAKLDPPEHIKARFDEEIEKLSMLETSSSEYGTTRNYIDIITSIPWGKMSKERLAGSKSKNAKQANAVNLERARKILDEDHEGLQDVKDRIIEFLAVGALKGHTSGQIMLFVGPPGVGKTSIGKSIAKALNRPFYRLSLGGIDDVSEIKGHRKTYIGAMPGKLVSAVRETKVMNPVIMLDEIDKLGKSYHGDPDSALLETLDPEQNKNFLDVYLDEKMDLSNCLFICTANSTETISAPLLDRMDPIRLSGYIAKEKFAIAKKHLLPRALEKAGLKRNTPSLRIPDDCLTALIDGYARESGVRSLERAIAKLIRKAAVKLIKGDSKVVINESDLESYLGTAPFKREKLLQGVGIQTGLAWTASGGVTLPVESIITSHDAAGFKLTGSLGDVMKESASIALSYVQSHLSMFCKTKAEASFFKKKTVHLHVPEGAIPKDGPSAGVTMATSLLSLALNKAPAEYHAMTGELTLTGHVLPIGGLREKVIAARRVGIFELIIPAGNEGDVKELPEHVRSDVTFYFADKYEDVAYTLFESVQGPLKKALPDYNGPRSVHFNADGLSPEDEAKKATEPPKAKTAASTASKSTKANAKAKTAATKKSGPATPAAPAPKSGAKRTTKVVSKAPAKKAPAAKATATKAVAKKPVAKTAAKKPAAKITMTAASKATAAKKTAATKATTAKASTTKAVAKKPAAKVTKTAASKATAATTATTTKASATKAVAMKPVAKTGAKKPAAKVTKTAASKATATKKTAATKATTAKARATKAVAKKPAAKTVAKTTAKKPTTRKKK